MRKVEVVFAHAKIRKFLSALEPPVRAEALRMLELLEEFGNKLKLPDSRALGGGLFELRVIDNIHVRLIYMFYQDRAVVLHGFIKKSRTIPKRELLYAKKIKKAYEDFV